MSYAESLASPSLAPTPPKPDILRGWIKTIKDAILVLEATRVGIVPRVTRRFHELEKRSIIQSGAILVFTEEESGIKRWTDPYLWSASRMQGNFLMYREREDEQGLDATSPYRCSAMAHPPEDGESRDPELEHYILGSWNKGKGLKTNGLMKKTISMTIEGTTYHLISYYYPSDVRSGMLQTPSSMPHLASLEVSSAVLDSLAHTQSRQSPLVGKRRKGRPPRSVSHPAQLLLRIPSSPGSPVPDTIVHPHGDSPSTPSGMVTSASWPPRTSSSSLINYAGTYSASPSPQSDVVPYSYLYDITVDSSHSPGKYDHTGFGYRPGDPVHLSWHTSSASVSATSSHPLYDRDFTTSAQYHNMHSSPTTTTANVDVSSVDAQQHIMRSWRPVINEANRMATSLFPTTRKQTSDVASPIAYCSQGSPLYY